jgi:hypothetical protein
MAEGGDRHYRSKLSAVRPGAGADCGRDLLDCPIAETGFSVRRQVGAIKYTEAGKRKPDLGAAEISVHFRLAEQASRRMTVAARYHS